MKQSKGEKAFTVLNYLILTMLAFTTVYPFLYTLVISLSTTKAAIAPGLHLYPTEISFLSYKMVFADKQIYTAYTITLFRTIVGTTLALLVTCMYAYALSRDCMPNKKIYTSIALFTMLFSGGQIPTYIVLKQYHLINSIWVYVLPLLISAYNVIIARSFFQSLPSSLIESAKIDGAGEYKIFFKIIIPLSKPIIMTLALWLAVQHWNSWYDAMMYITDNNKITVQAYLQKIVQENNMQLVSQWVQNPDNLEFTPATIKSATIVVSILPILAGYPFIQKYFTKGIMLGAVKG